MLGQKSKLADSRFSIHTQNDRRTSLRDARVKKLIEGEVELSFLLVELRPKGGQGEGSPARVAEKALHPLAVGASEEATFSDDRVGFRTGIFSWALRIWALGSHMRGQHRNF